MQTVPNHSSNSNGNSPLGGQYSIGLFGLPSVSNARRFQPPDLPHVASPTALVASRRRNRFQAFMRLAVRERRPVDEVMAEWLSDCTALIGRDELFEDSSCVVTPATYHAARASDERELHGRIDDEHADHLHRCGGTGYIEITLAMES